MIKRYKFESGKFRLMTEGYFHICLKRIQRFNVHCATYHRIRSGRYIPYDIPTCTICRLPIVVGQYFTKLSSHTKKYVHEGCYDLAFQDSKDVEKEEENEASIPT